MQAAQCGDRFPDQPENKLTLWRPKLKKHQSKNTAAVWEHQLEDAAIIWSETDLKIQHSWDNKVRKQHFVESNFQSRERGLNQTHGSKTKVGDETCNIPTLLGLKSTTTPTMWGHQPVNTSVGWTPPLTLRQTLQSITVPNKTLLDNRYWIICSYLHLALTKLQKETRNIWKK